MKEKLLRQHGTLLQQSKSVKENQQVNNAAEKLIEQERSAVQAAVKLGVENVKADLVLKSASLAQAVEEWREGKLSSANAAAEPLRADIETIDAEIAQLKGWCGEDDDALLETFYAAKLEAVRKLGKAARVGARQHAERRRRGGARLNARRWRGGCLHACALHGTVSGGIKAARACVYLLSFAEDCILVLFPFASLPRQHLS